MLIEYSCHRFEFAFKSKVLPCKLTIWLYLHDLIVELQDTEQHLLIANK